MSLKNVMVAQSGGPTVAINASLAGVIRGVMASDQYETVYGSVNGILGILNNHLLNLTEIMNENPGYWIVWKQDTGNVFRFLPS